MESSVPPVTITGLDHLVLTVADLEAAALRWGLPLVDVGDLRAWL